VVAAAVALPPPLLLLLVLLVLLLPTLRRLGSRSAIGASAAGSAFTRLQAYN
jgi:hypothetical protein